MSSSDIVFRSVKGSKLTIGEVDGNFQELVDLLDPDGDGSDEIYWTAGVLTVEDRLRLYDATSTARVDIETDSPTAPAVVRVLRTGSQTWDVGLPASTDNFALLNVSSGNTKPFVVSSGAPADRLHVGGPGVGIGTASPGELLHLKDPGADSDPTIKIENDVQAFGLQVDGASGDSFLIRDITNSTIPVALGPNVSDWTLVIASGKIGINQPSPAASAVLDITSTTGALLVPRMTTTQRNALTATNGMIIYNTTTNQMEGYINGGWAAM